jgi:outer membrane biosynthesis protein TonB
MSFEIPGPQAPPSDERLAMIEQRLASLNQALLALVAAAAPKLLEDFAGEPGAGQEIEAVLEAINEIQARVSAAGVREALGPAPAPPQAVAIVEPSPLAAPRALPAPAAPAPTALPATVEPPAPPASTAPQAPAPSPPPALVVPAAIAEPPVPAAPTAPAASPAAPPAPTAPTAPTASTAPTAPTAPAGSWRDAVPPELFERLRSRSNGAGRPASG